jgi:hypothetical protein
MRLSELIHEIIEMSYALFGNHFMVIFGIHVTEFRK